MAVRHPKDKLQLQQAAEWTKKALDLVKADGGSKARLLEIMKAVDPAATSIPTVNPQHYKGLYDGIDAALAGV